MKLLHLACTSTVAALLLSTMTATAADSAKKKADKAEARKSEAARPAKSQLLHLVSFKFKDSATKEEIKKVEDVFRALKSKVPQIKKLVWGLNNSPEGLNKGCTHAWVLTFGSEADRDAYLVHPDHREFGKLVGPLLGDVFVVDFWTKD